MKSKTIKNLVIGSITLLGISYVVESYIKNKKRNLEIQESKERNELKELDRRVKRNYITLAEIVNEDGKYHCKKIN